MAVTINGSAGVTTNSGAVYDGIQRLTAVASTSGTSISFSSIPSWCKRLTVMFNGVSTSGTSNYLIRLNSEATGYTGEADSLDSNATDTTGFILTASQVGASNIGDGVVTIVNLSGNLWISTGIVRQSTTRNCYSAGGKTTSAVVSSVQITTVNGTDTFDAGTINILYE